MSSTINASTASGGGVITTADASGILQLQTAGVTALSIDASQKVTFANSLTSPTLVTPIINGMASSILTSGIAVASTSGTNIDFTGIPSWAKRITVMFNEISTSGTSNILLQLGTSLGIQTSGYTGVFGYIGAPGDNMIANSPGFGLYNDTASDLRSGTITLNLLNSATGIWTCSGITSWSTRLYSLPTSGSKTLSGTLNRVRITTANGTDTFDAGFINIMYE